MHNLNMIFRQMRRQPLHTTIITASLTLSMVSCLLIGSYVSGELSIDGQNKNIEEIVLFRQFEKSALSGGQFAADLKLRFPQVENTARFRQMNVLVSGDGDGTYEPDFYFADPAMADIFTFQWKSGSPQQALAQMNGIAISENTAARYFGTEDPIGKKLTVNSKYRFIVQAVFSNIVGRSHIQPEMMASYKNAEEVSGFDVNTTYWSASGFTYLLLKKGTNIEQLSAQLPAYVESLNDPNAPYVWKPDLIPLKDLYLRTTLISNNPITYVYIFSGAGILILLLAGFNYVNMSTARVAIRQKNVAMHKLLGSSLQSIRIHFMLETAIYIGISLLLSTLITLLLLPVINKWNDLHLNVLNLLSPVNIAISLGLVFLLILLAGMYPALLLSSAKPIAALKSAAAFSSSKSLLRKVLVVGQFAVSFIMIVITLVVYNQLNFIQSKNLGYSREQVLTVDFRDASTKDQKLLKQELMKLPQVVSSSISFDLPGSNVFQNQKLIEELVPKGTEDASIGRITIDEDFAKTFDIKLLQGRMLNENREADKGKYLVNEAAMKKFGWKDITDKFTGYYTYEYNESGQYKEVPQRGEVVGVLSDYHHNDLKSAIIPMIFSLNDGYQSKFGIKLKAGTIASALPAIEEKWKSVFPSRPFSYSFMDDTFNKTYFSELQTGRIFGAFSLITILISCMGLFGLVFFALQRRQKEISIRKVLGAGVANIASTISKEFFVLLVVAGLLGLPVAWIAANKWLQMFAYRMELNGGLMLLPLLLLLLVVTISIGWHVLKAANADPIKNLRTE